MVPSLRTCHFMFLFLSTTCNGKYSILSSKQDRSFTNKIFSGFRSVWISLHFSFKSFRQPRTCLVKSWITEMWNPRKSFSSKYWYKLFPNFSNINQYCSGCLLDFLNLKKFLTLTTRFTLSLISQRILASILADFTYLGTARIILQA